MRITDLSREQLVCVKELRQEGDYSEDEAMQDYAKCRQDGLVCQIERTGMNYEVTSVQYVERTEGRGI